MVGIDSVSSILTAAAGGSALKIVSGALHGWMEAKRANMEIERDKWLAHSEIDLKAYEKFTTPKDSPTTRWTLNTRRILAVSITWTFCVIALLCTFWPSAELIVLDPQPEGSTKFLWGLFSYTRAATPTVVITSGAVVWAQLHLLTMVLSMYFTPVGKT